MTPLQLAESVRDALISSMPYIEGCEVYSKKAHQENIKKCEKAISATNQLITYLTRLESPEMVEEVARAWGIIRSDYFIGHYDYDTLHEKAKAHVREKAKAAIEVIKKGIV